ncbi:phage protein NinX family protein [Escherichia coli]|nr:phage protein NinX family protein [Escherichia coli]MDY8084849.1 phage protein NinX family protein [Escherichia coli]MDY8128458.1 phage protein NinX family protein [Escherichia coli]
MDYSQLSDFEINVAVFEAIHNGSPDYKEGENGAMVFISFEGDIVNGDAVEVEVDRGSFNPCANPADAWPIITENKISTMWMTAEKEWCAWSGGDLEEGCWEWENIPDYCFCGESPLRAAMIVFLMMQDANNA